VGQTIRNRSGDAIVQSRRERIEKKEKAWTSLPGVHWQPKASGRTIVQTLRLSPIHRPRGGGENPVEGALARAYFSTVVTIVVSFGILSG
jgi:hypothetical protein